MSISYRADESKKAIKSSCPVKDCDGKGNSNPNSKGLRHWSEGNCPNKHKSLALVLSESPAIVPTVNSSLENHESQMEKKFSCQHFLNIF